MRRLALALLLAASPLAADEPAPGSNPIIRDRFKADAPGHPDRRRSDRACALKDADPQAQALRLARRDQGHPAGIGSVGQVVDRLEAQD